MKFTLNTQFVSPKFSEDSVEFFAKIENEKDDDNIAIVNKISGLVMENRIKHFSPASDNTLHIVCRIEDFKGMGRTYPENQLTITFDFGEEK